MTLVRLLIAALALVPLDGVAAAEPRPIVLVESFPIETTLDHPDIADAADVWLQMIEGAKRSLDFAEFYVTNQAGSRLEPVLRAIEAAAERGVRVRLLVDAKFAKNEHATLDTLSKKIVVRRFDVGPLMGGILHAKYFVVDGSEAYLGSQNLDWRSLTHIQELGVRLAAPPLVRALADVFETDWSLAGGAPREQRTAPPPGGYGFPLQAGDLQLTLVASPKGFLPDERLWDLPRIIELLDGAKRTVRVQLLTYQSTERGGYFDELESALRRAAARGVTVQLLVADWGRRPGSIEGLQSLSVLPHVEVKLATIPPWSGGFVPFARVIHAKYLVVDGEKSWVGTSNWSRDYFYQSRNVGVIALGKSFGERLDRFFLDGWNAPYASKVDPCGHYVAPKTH